MTENGRALLRSTLLRPSVLEDLMKPWSEWMEEKWPYPSHTPSVNVKETDTNYEISLAVPGLQKDDFKIDVTGTMITISAETEEKREHEDAAFRRKEYSYTTFSRSFTLPLNIAIEKIDANYVNGELKLLLPKNEEAKKTVPHKISVH